MPTPSSIAARPSILLAALGACALVLAVVFSAYPVHAQGEETLTSVAAAGVTARSNSPATGLPANAQEASAVVWETKLTVWAPSPTVTWPPAVGWTSNFAGRDWLGTIASRTFTFEGNDYEVVQLMVERTTSTLSLVFKAAKDGEKEDRDLLRLRFIEGTAEHTYDLADATTTSIDNPGLGAFTRLAWSGVTDTALGWADGDSITVKMERIDTEADGVASTPNQPGDGPAYDHRTRPGGRDPDGGHVGHRRRRWAGQGHLQLPMDSARRGTDRRHRGRHWLHIHAV